MKRFHPEKSSPCSLQNLHWQCSSKLILGSSNLSLTNKLSTYFPLCVTVLQPQCTETHTRLYCSTNFAILIDNWFVSLFNCHIRLHLNLWELVILLRVQTSWRILNVHLIWQTSTFFGLYQLLRSICCFLFGAAWDSFLLQIKTAMRAEDDPTLEKLWARHLRNNPKIAFKLWLLHTWVITNNNGEKRAKLLQF